ncbi:MAG: DUF1007 family protein [Hyphomicrobiales bacterium]|nr:DUF1007 family protein [Hyphomicrobiales bacterium]
MSATVIAHPHVFIDARVTVVFDGDRIVALKHRWTFDDAYSAFAVQGLDENGDGAYSGDELAELATVNVESLSEFDFFTYAGDHAEDMEFALPSPGYGLEFRQVGLDDFWLLTDEDRAFIREQVERENRPELLDVGLLTLEFTLPLAEPFPVREAVEIDVYDPTYYISFEFRDGAVALEGAPADCRAEVVPPQELDDETAAVLNAIPQDVTELPSELLEVTTKLANRVMIRCGAATALSAAEAIAEIAEKAPGALPREAAPATATEPAVQAEAPANDAHRPLKVGVFSRILGEIARQQNAFYAKLRDTLRLSAADGSAVWTLMLISFLYGIFHAAGPGHGKAVVTSYLLANARSVRTGAMLSFAAAFVQALTAIGLIGIAGVILKLTSIAIEDTAGAFQIGSYALIVVLGLWLVWSKVFRGGHSHHDHDNGHGHDHGDHHHHHHGPGETCEVPGCGHEVAVRLDWQNRGGAVAAVLSVGLRPCTGALIILAFALAQGLFLAGVASAFVMAFGTGITVAALAGLAVGAKGLAVKLAGPESRIGHTIHRGIEIAAAFLVLGIGIVLLTAATGFPMT